MAPTQCVFQVTHRYATSTRWMIICVSSFGFWQFNLLRLLFKIVPLLCVIVKNTFWTMALWKSENNIYIYNIPLIAASGVIQCAADMRNSYTDSQSDGFLYQKAASEEPALLVIIVITMTLSAVSSSQIQWNTCMLSNRWITYEIDNHYQVHANGNVL